MDFMANGLLALGAAPAMVHSVDELEVVRISTKGLVYVSLEKDSEPHKKYEKKHSKHDFFFVFSSQTRLREKLLQYTSKFMKFLFEKGTVGTCVCFRFRSL